MFYFYLVIQMCKLVLIINLCATVGGVVGELDLDALTRSLSAMHFFFTRAR